MSTPKSQYFMGYKFTRGEEGTYYRCAKLKKRMHSFVWEYYNGPIPKGYEVHHKDFNKANNDISNLILLTISEHRKLHASLLTDEQREWKRQNLNKNARPKAIEWHKSEEGHLWHKGLLKKQREIKPKKEELICSYCGKKYIGERWSKTSETYCSDFCRRRGYKKRHTNDVFVKVCPICNNEFKCHDKRTLTCSRVCAERLRRLNHANKISD